jgi:hypothetical protein
MWLAWTRTIHDMTHATLCSPGRRTMACLNSLNSTSRHELLVEMVKPSCLWLGHQLVRAMIMPLRTMNLLQALIE